MKRNIKYTGAVVLLLLSNSASFAQQVEDKPVEIPQIFFEPVTYIWMMLAFILIVTIYVLTRSVNALTKELDRRFKAEAGITETVTPMAEYVEKNEETAWDKLMKAMTRSVPVEKEKDVMLDHNYDGIRELDNQLPPWWKYGFYLTIVFGLVYLVVYHVSGSANLQLAEYQESIDQAEQERQSRIAMSANYITEENVKMTTDPNELAEGKDIYMKNCVACHGEKGEGKVGPNLTDEFWIHGGGVKNIFHTINEGVPAKGMISWKNQFSPKKIAELSSYILTLKGTNPAGGLDPQGDKWIDVQDSSVAAAPPDSANLTIASK